MTKHAEELDTATAVLAAARATKAGVDREEARLLLLVDDAVARQVTGGRHVTIDPALEAFDGTAEVHGSSTSMRRSAAPRPSSGTSGAGELARAQLAPNLAGPVGG